MRPLTIVSSCLAGVPCRYDGRAKPDAEVVAAVAAGDAVALCAEVAGGMSTPRPAAEIRGGEIGFVFQSFHLLPTRTVLENVMLATAYAGVPRQDRERLAHGALARVDMSHRTDFYPGTLSGGEKQRVAIARAVSTSPRLLLADEPTGNLDQTNSQGVMALFEELSEDGLTIVMITHDPIVAKSARRRASIHDGRLTELD